MLVADAPRPLLPFGLGRSYGDSCLNDGGTLIDTSRLDRFISFDDEQGTLVCEAGVSIASILKLLASKPRSDGGFWFLPVVPGTKFVTVGGAIANDVHGKNHELEATFGRHVEWLDIARSDGSSLRASREQNRDLFNATIAGLGLTGLVTAAAVKLMPVPSLTVEVEHVALDSLDDYFRLAEESRREWTHHAAWIDVLATGVNIGRGIYTRSRFVWEVGDARARASKDGPRVPADAPQWLIGEASIRAFNALYRRKLLGRQRVAERSHYDPVFFPLDGVRDWNRLYGARGFYQYQCVIPRDSARYAVRELLSVIAAVGEGSFLSVLKELGPIESPGLMSFPMEGTTLAVDFPNKGPSTEALLCRLDDITMAAGGRIYPAKDGRSAASTFRAGYPRIREFEAHIDPAFSSTFWRRTAVTH